MKIKMIVCSALATALLTGCVIIKNEGQEDHNKKCEQSEHHEKKGENGEKGEAQNKEAAQSQFMAETKVGKEAAQQTALAKIPNGAIKEGELEKENGKLQWSFDVATPGSKDITEVNVDAMTGEVISVGKEPADNDASQNKDKD
jgi:uncharacterized membrane protein YkoI